MTNHLTNDQLNSYLHQTLADAEREALDRHLADCAACRARLDGHEALQRRIRYELATELRSVQPFPQMSYAAIAPHLKRSRRITMVLKQSNQFIYGALTMALLIAVGAGLYFFLSNLSRPTPTTPEEVEQPAVPTVVSQPEVKATVEIAQPEVNPTAEVSLPTVDLTSTGAMFRGNPQHTGVFDTPGPERGELKWKFKTNGTGLISPAIVNGIIYQTGQEKWKFQTDADIISSPTVADGVIYFGIEDAYLYAVR